MHTSDVLMNYLGHCYMLAVLGIIELYLDVADQCRKMSFDLYYCIPVSP